MRCPWPVLRMARAMREAGATGGVRMLADDPKAEGEIADLARANGWQFAVEPQDDALLITVSRP